ncbi:MAG: hypothetical protein LBQ31_07380, partial [Bacteroidales bacterium]|nr:hypothetical protein [Bacteroidales bacterium]
PPCSPLFTILALLTSASLLYSLTHPTSPLSVPTLSSHAYGNVTHSQNRSNPPILSYFNHYSKYVQKPTRPTTDQKRPAIV